jgi:hypothetical protein
MFVDEAQPMVRNAMFFAVAMTVPFSFASCCLRRGPEQHKILELRLSIQEGNAGGGSQRRMFCMKESLLLRRLTQYYQYTGDDGNPGVSMRGGACRKPGFV